MMDSVNFGRSEIANKRLEGLPTYLNMMLLSAAVQFTQHECWSLSMLLLLYPGRGGGGGTCAPHLPLVINIE